MDVTIKRKWSHTCQVGGGKRKKITGLSQKAQENMLFKARNCEGFKVLITLTYPAEYPHDGTLVKYHWKRMKQWLTRRGFQGFWFLEFQKRGAPHYHIFLTGYVDIKAVQKMWYDVVASGDEKHLRAGVRVEKIRMEHCAAAYAAKYAGKREQKEVPADYQNVGRFWGLFGGLKPTLYARSEGENKGEMAQRVRALKRLYQEYRKRRGLGTPRKDKGLYSFKLWGISTWAQMDVFRCAEGRLASSPTFAT
jgi:glycosyltransferase involved in cell wall biosynthesis